jgi:hypothetical protein
MRKRLEVFSRVGYRSWDKRVAQTEGREFIADLNESVGMPVPRAARAAIVSVPEAVVDNANRV